MRMLEEGSSSEQRGFLAQYMILQGKHSTYLRLSGFYQHSHQMHGIGETTLAT